MSHRSAPLAWIARALVLAVAASCCTQGNDAVVIAAPHDRYDHNREVQVAEWTYHKRGADGVPAPHALALDRPARDETYTPRGHRSVPAAAAPLAPDEVPAANLVPVFPGILLPLDPQRPGGAGDRDDLVDFLGTGPAAQAGVERRDVQGALPAEVEQRYAAVLGLLGAAAQLESRERVLAWAAANGVRHSLRVVDTRYAAISFADRVALQQGDFWFVLFALPAAAGAPPRPYTRLVVVPAGPLWQSPDKRPGS